MEGNSQPAQPAGWTTSPSNLKSISPGQCYKCLWECWQLLGWLSWIELHLENTKKVMGRSETFLVRHPV